VIVPRGGGIGGIVGGVAEGFLVVTDQDRLAGAEQVAEGGRFVVETVENDVGRPGRFVGIGTGILIPRGGLAGESQDEHIGPTVGVESRDQRRKNYPNRRADRRAGPDRGETLFELRAGIPVRPRDGVLVAVVVEVGEGGPLGEKGSAELVFGVVGQGGGVTGNGGGQQAGDEEGT